VGLRGLLRCVFECLSFLRGRWGGKGFFLALGSRRWGISFESRGEVEVGVFVVGESREWDRRLSEG